MTGLVWVYICSIFVLYWFAIVPDYEVCYSILVYVFQIISVTTKLVFLFITHPRLYQGDKHGDIKMIYPRYGFCPAAKTKMASDSKSVVKKQNIL